MLAGVRAPPAIGAAYARGFNGVFAAVARAEGVPPARRHARRREWSTGLAPGRWAPPQRRRSAGNRRASGAAGRRRPNSTPMIRLFVAIAVPEVIGEGLARRQQGVPGARWRALEQLHVTLRFAGEIAEPAATDWDAELSGIKGRAFEIELNGVGAFAEERERGALWAGVAQSEPLRLLAGRCEGAARRAGLEGRAARLPPPRHPGLPQAGGPGSRGGLGPGAQPPALAALPGRGLRPVFQLAGRRAGSAYRLERRYDWSWNHERSSPTPERPLSASQPMRARSPRRGRCPATWSSSTWRMPCCRKPRRRRAPRLSRRFAKAASPGGKSIIRVNGLSTRWGEDDLAAAAAAGPDAVLVPKIDGPEDIVEVDQRLAEAPPSNPVVGDDRDRRGGPGHRGHRPREPA